jgi:hypothetical protein
VPRHRGALEGGKGRRIADSGATAALETIRRHEQSRDDDVLEARLFRARLLPTLPERLICPSPPLRAARSSQRRHR